MQQSTISGNSQVFHQWEIHLHRKTADWKFLNGNRQGADVLNESVAQC